MPGDVEVVPPPKKKKGEQLPAVEAPPLTPLIMLGRAVEQGASIEVLERLTALYERWEANQARRAYDAAIAEAKADIPVIRKLRKVSFGVGRAAFKHEDLGEIARTVDPILSKHGLSYRWRTSSKVGEPVLVTCVVSHRAGHFEENSLDAAPDNTGGKNTIQAIGSAVTYLQRYTLKAALGLAAAEDDDGRASTPVMLVNEQQVENVKALLAAIGDTKLPDRFMKHFKIERIEDLPVADYDDAVTQLEKKKAAASEPAAAATGNG
jgi:ERF superfamily